MLVVWELGEVLVGEVGGARQLVVGEQAEDVGSLTLAPMVDCGCRVVLGAPGVHELIVVVGAGGSLSIDWPAE